MQWTQTLNGHDTLPTSPNSSDTSKCCANENDKALAGALRKIPKTRHGHKFEVSKLEAKSNVQKCNTHKSAKFVQLTLDAAFAPPHRLSTVRFARLQTLHHCSRIQNLGGKRAAFDVEVDHQSDISISTLNHKARVMLIICYRQLRLDHVTSHVITSHHSLSKAVELLEY